MRRVRLIGGLFGLLCLVVAAAVGGCQAMAGGAGEEGDGAPGGDPPVTEEVPAGEEFVAGTVTWSAEVVDARPRFDAGNVAQSSNVDANRRTADRVSVTGSDETLAVHVENPNGGPPVTLAAADAIETKRIDGGTRRVLQTDVGGRSTAYAVTYELPDRLFDLVLGHWIVEHGQGQSDGGVFADSSSCDVDRVARSDVQNYSGSGFGIVGIEEGGVPQQTLLRGLEVSRFYANFGTGQVHADVLDGGGGRRVILTGRMSDDRTRFRGVVSTQIDGVLIEVGTWGGLFCTEGATRQATARTRMAAASTSNEDGGALVITAAYEYRADGQDISAMAVMEAQQSAGDGEADDIVRDSVPSFSGLSIADQSYIKGEPIGPLVLPVAVGGDGTVLYGLSQVPDGLSFSSSSRTLAGTPTRSDAYAIGYTAQDSDGDKATLNFTVTVADPPALEAAGDDDDGEADDDGSGSDDDGVSTDDDDGLSDDDGSGGDDDGFSSDDDDGDRDDDGSGGDDDGFDSDDDDGLSDDDGTGGDDDGFVGDDDDGVSDDDGSGGDDDGSSSDDDDGDGDSGDDGDNDDDN